MSGLIAFGLKYWYLIAIGVLVVALGVAGSAISSRNKEIDAQKLVIHDRDNTVKALNLTIGARDQQLKDVGKTGSKDYETLSKQCGSDAKVWFDRGVAVGRNVCPVRVPDQTDNGGPGSAGTAHPAPVR